MNRLSVLAFAIALGFALGLDCAGTLSNQVIEEVLFVRSNTGCTLRNVNVTNNVVVQKGARLVTNGVCTFFSTLKLEDAGGVSLGGDFSSNAGVESKGCESLSIGTNANVGALMLMDTPSNILGKVNRIIAMGRGPLTLTGATVTDGGLFASELTGNIKMCGVNLRGGISIEGGSVNLDSEARADCAPNSFDGTISVIETTGNIAIVGATATAADLICEKNKGNVVARGTSFSDVKCAEMEGDVTLEECVLDSDASFSGIKGKLTLNRCTVSGDLAVSDVKSNGGDSVIITRSNFKREDLTVEKNGNVRVERNRKFGGKFISNGEVAFYRNRNKVTNVELVGNAKIEVKNNKAESISCVDNKSVGTVSGNTVINPATGNDDCQIGV